MAPHYLQMFVEKLNFPTGAIVIIYEVNVSAPDYKPSDSV